MIELTSTITRDKTNGDGLRSLRPLSELAYIIEQNWLNPGPSALLHIEALSDMTNTRSVLWGTTGADAARLFLLTSRKWHGDTAREVKAELRAHLAAHNAQ
jgi:hypothetical protein